MEILILIVIAVLAILIFRGLFDRSWRAKAQDTIDGIRNEKNFWYLMSQKINAEKVFSVYLRTRNQKDYIRVGDCVMDIYSNENEANKNDFDIKTIKKGDSIKIINSVLNPKIQDKEKLISGFLAENKISFTEEEIRKSFKDFFEEHFWNVDEVQKHYNRFMSAHLDSLVKSDKTGTGIWKVLKDFADKEHEFEFDRSGEKHVDFLGSLKMLQNDVNDFVVDLLCKKFENKDKSEKLKKLLVEWRQLNMLRWCVVDFSVWQIGKNGIQSMLWRAATAIFL